MKRAVASSLALASLLAASSVRAAGTEEHRALMLAGQLMRADGKLLRARDLLAECQSQECDAGADVECKSIQSFCRQKLVELDGEIPSVRVSVVDERGAPLPRAIKWIGSTVIETNAPILLDPGKHVLRAEYTGRSTLVDFEAVRGSGSRELHAVIDLRRTVTERPTPWPVWALGVTSAVSIASFAVLGTIATSRASGFDDCRPTCELSKRGSYEATTIAADVSLAVGVIAAISGAVFYLARPRVERVVHVDAADSGRRSGSAL